MIAAGEGDAGKVDFEEFSVAGAVGGGVEDGVDVVEDGFGGGSVAEFASDGVEEVLRKVWASSYLYFSFYSCFRIEIKRKYKSVI